MMSTLVNFQELPVIGTDPPERADAARNRRRILAAAEKLFAENGVSCTSMDAIAAEAGVGKGTLFRRFGDRASLARALLSERDSGFQEAFIRGEPPLGPGAPARERLHAFGKAYLDVLDTHHALIVEAERAPRFVMAPYVAYRTHLLILLREASPVCDADVAADALLAVLAAGLFAHLRGDREVELDRLAAVWCAMVDGVIAAA